jgi:hypothetical protein
MAAKTAHNVTLLNKREIKVLKAAAIENDEAPQVVA